MIQGMNDFSCLSSNVVIEFPQGITDRPALLLVKVGNAIVAQS